MKVIGITGGIGVGKTVVSNILRIMDFPVYDSDEQCKQLADNSIEIKKQIVSLFGCDIYVGGFLNRKKMAELVFSSEEKRLLLQKILHPAVQKDFIQWCEKQNNRFVFIESAILVESGFRCMLDALLVVTAPEDLRIRRIMQRNNCSQEQAFERMRAQMPAEELNKMADAVIVNDNKQLLIPQILRFLDAFS